MARLAIVTSETDNSNTIKCPYCFKEHTYPKDVGTGFIRPFCRKNGVIHFLEPI